jgi:hypothetical protein
MFTFVHVTLAYNAFEAERERERERGKCWYVKMIRATKKTE